MTPIKRMPDFISSLATLRSPSQCPLSHVGKLGVTYERSLATSGRPRTTSGAHELHWNAHERPKLADEARTVDGRPGSSGGPASAPLTLRLPANIINSRFERI